MTLCRGRALVLAAEDEYVAAEHWAQEYNERIWTIIGVDHVAHSFNWYQSLLGTPPSVPAHDDSVRFSTPTERSCFASTSGARMSIRH
jgi:hypothetical protein